MQNSNLCSPPCGVHLREAENVTRTRIAFTALSIAALACSSLPGIDLLRPQTQPNAQPAASDGEQPPSLQPAASMPPTWTPTPMESPTVVAVTSTPVEETATEQPTAEVENWIRYEIQDVSLSLPPDWRTVDVAQEGVAGVQAVLQEFGTPWSDAVYDFLSSPEIADSMKFWGVGPTPAGQGYPSMNLMFAPLDTPTTAEAFAEETRATYRQIGISVLDVRAPIEINGYDSARLMVQLPMGPYTNQQYQYIMVKEDHAWILTCAVGVSAWIQYRATFEAMALSFGR